MGNDYYFESHKWKMYDLTRFKKIAIEGTPQMAVDKEAIAYQESTHIVIYKCTLPLY